MRRFSRVQTSNRRVGQRVPPSLPNHRPGHCVAPSPDAKLRAIAHENLSER